MRYIKFAGFMFNILFVLNVTNAQYFNQIQ